MNKRPILRISPADLDNLMSTLEVNIVALSECLVSAGYRLDMGGVGAPGIHYNLSGFGRMLIGDNPPIDLKPHTLIIVPPNTPFQIEVTDESGSLIALKHVDGRKQTMADGLVRRFVAGEGQPEVILICGFFHAIYGTSTELFGMLTNPIIEQFDAQDHLDTRLKWALTELVSQEVATGAMTGALLKQVIVSLLRRSLVSVNSWVERFAMLSDPQIARAFAEMAHSPGLPHTVNSLAQSACLSRSAFMARFTDIVGQSPMITLRELRMRQASRQLRANTVPIDRIAHNAGYESRSSFVRAFRKTYGVDPSDYRDAARAKGDDISMTKQIEVIPHQDFDTADGETVHPASLFIG